MLTAFYANIRSKRTEERYLGGEKKCVEEMIEQLKYLKSEEITRYMLRAFIGKLVKDMVSSCARENMAEIT